jgi:hypothetical protein
VKNEKLRNIHILIEEEDLNRIKKLCTHKGDLTWHLQQAVKHYLIPKEEKFKTPTQEQKPKRRDSNLMSILRELGPQELEEIEKFLKQKKEEKRDESKGLIHDEELLERLRRPRSGIRGGRKGYEQLTDYLFPVIRLIKSRVKHTDAFHRIAKELGVTYQTANAQCTVRLGHISTEQFVELIKSNKIKSFLKERFPDKASLIERDLTF